MQVHVEAALAPGCRLSRARAGELVTELLQETVAVLENGPVAFEGVPELRDNLESLAVVDLEAPVQTWEAQLRVHAFAFNDEGAAEETLEGEDIAAGQEWTLPAAEFAGLWDSLVYDHGIKRTLLEYSETALWFADQGVDPNLVAWNRVVLLHGPPGTGKTSLCKALAQKLAVRLCDRYSAVQLLEVNAHSLFSKWFSESGKLVQRLFAHVLELVEDGDSMVCVLIDEVESLTAARQAAVSGAEPGDAIRVVNALLTQLDALRAYPNVLILTTSNITDAVDVAFVDRADIKQFIGPPSPAARYQILRSCLEELQRARICFPPEPLLPFEDAQAPAAQGTASEVLARVAHAAEGLSGRALRKLPFQAHALFVRAPEATPGDFAMALGRAVEAELGARREMSCG